MDFFEDVDPIELTEFSRAIVEAADGAEGTLSDVLPNEQHDETTFKWVSSERKALLGHVRTWDTETPIAEPDSEGEERIASLPPVGLKQRFSEYEQLLRMGRNHPETVQQAAERKAVDVAKGTLDRVILFRGEALQTGKLAIRENGVRQNVDYLRRPDFTRTAPSLLTDPGFDFMEWLEQLLQDFADENSDGLPDVAITSRRVANAVRRNLVTAGHFGELTTPQKVRNEDVNELLADTGAPALVINERRAGGRRVIDDDKIVFAPAGTAGRTIWGRTVESFDPEYATFDQAQAPGLLVGAYAQKDPAVKWIRANAIALPVVINPNETLAAKVL